MRREAACAESLIFHQLTGEIPENGTIVKSGLASLAELSCTKLDYSMLLHQTSDHPHSSSALSSTQLVQISFTRVSHD